MRTSRRGTCSAATCSGADARFSLARAWLRLRQEEAANGECLHRVPPGREGFIGTPSTGFTRGYFHIVPPGRAPATCGRADARGGSHGLGCFPTHAKRPHGWGTGLARAWLLSTHAKKPHGWGTGFISDSHPSTKTSAWLGGQLNLLRGGMCVVLFLVRRFSPAGCRGWGVRVVRFP